MKKFFSILALTAISAAQIHAIEFDDGIFHYATINDVDNDVKVSLIAGSTVPADLEIPTEVTFLGKTYTVTHLAGWMFSENENLQSVKLPERMTTFEYAVFEDCINLKTVILPESLKWIGKYCFIRCSSLDNVIIPEGVTFIGQDAFTNCTALNEIRIPDSVTTLENNAFTGAGIKKIVFGSGISEIPVGSCAWCTKLTDIVIPDNIKTIKPNAFEQAISLTRINVGAPDVIFINAFLDCTNLKEIEVKTTVPPICVEESFPETTYNGTLLVPTEECIATYKADEVWGKFATIKVTNGSGVEDIVSDDNLNGKVYNLQGIYVSDDIKNVTTPGVYVTNGKKVIIK